MNTNPFSYYRPENKMELIDLIEGLKNEKKVYAFYAGGTELVTLFRKGKVKVEAIVDLKGVEPLRKIIVEEDRLIIGAAVPLNQVIEKLSVDPIKKALKGIADHTVRNTLTIGGNLCGRLPYREAVLPLICRGAILNVLEEGELRSYPIKAIFDKRLKLKANALLWTIEMPTAAVELELSQRFTATTGVDYPIIHHYTVLEDDILNIAISGYSSYPIYESFNIRDLDFSKETFLSVFLNEAKSDDRASAEYRQALLMRITKNVIRSMREKGGIL